MDTQQRQRLLAILLGIQEWEDPRSRKSLLGFLRGHDIWLRLMRGGSDIEAADDLLDLITDPKLARIPVQGRSPICALIDQLKAKLAVKPASLAELTRLSDALCNRPLDLPRVTWRHPPYPGLAYFDRDDWPIYFGRETELQRLILALSGKPPEHPGPRFLVVVGASGSGKSSLVRAGLWARLDQGLVPELSGSEAWLVTAMTPADPIADDPLAVLRARTVEAIGDSKRFTHLARFDWRARMDAIARGDASLADLAGDLLAQSPSEARWLLILDQMEELFTAYTPERREPFIEQLVEAVRPGAGAESPRLQVLATLRADFFHHCVAHPDLRFLVEGDGSFLLGAPERLALERMIEAPITEVDLAGFNGEGSGTAVPWAIDRALVHRLAAAADGRDGGLALMAFALRELYERGTRERRIDMSAYTEMGGLGGAIARRANEELQRLGAGAELALSRVFAHLVHVSEDEASTRRRAERWIWEGDREANALIDAFIQARLLVGGDDGKGNPTVEVAHEALLREWPRLVEWIKDSREALRLRDRVREEARAWANCGRPAIRLWKHELLEPARKLLAEAGLLKDLEDPARSPDTADFLIREAEWLIAELLCTGTDHARREAIGMRLSAIGDPRPGVGLREDGVPDILWCEIPEGLVEIEGSGRRQVTPFRIAAYPVTYAQYRAFLEAEDGHRSARWWDDLQHMKEPGRQLRPYASYPVDKVSWYDATAFCRWLSSRLGFEVRLPDEWEWQWAAQSARRDFVYPWGEDWQEGVANTAEAGIGRTTAVGMYPAGRSVEGVYDLGGNVWEWCRNEHGDPSKTQPGGDEPRVVRGGSWFLNQDDARAGFRYNLLPDSRNDNYGFRVVCASPIR